MNTAAHQAPAGGVNTQQLWAAVVLQAQVYSSERN